jgi:uncharacterized protein (TIGR02001 family)
MQFTTKISAALLLALGANTAFAADQATSEHQISGNIAVVSSYNVRGLTNVPDNDKATIQGGLDYSHASGFYAGYWGSTLGYSLTDYDPIVGDYTGRDSFEHDFYLGYNGSINEDWGYNVGAVYYYYYESDANADGFESILGVNYKDFSVTAQTLWDDITWGNAGDTYLLASYSHALPRDFTLNTALGLYYYNDDTSKYFDTTEDFGFRHFNVGLSHPLGNTGADMSVDFIVGGYDRVDEKQKNKVVFGLSYSF